MIGTLDRALTTPPEKGDASTRVLAFAQQLSALSDEIMDDGLISYYVTYLPEPDNDDMTRIKDYIFKYMSREDPEHYDEMVDLHLDQQIDIQSEVDSNVRRAVVTICVNKYADDRLFDAMYQDLAAVVNHYSGMIISKDRLGSADLLHNMYKYEVMFAGTIK